MTESTKSNQNPDDPQFWQQHVEQYRLARGSKLAYCRKHGLTYHRFLYWAEKFKKRPLATKSLPQFVPLKLTKSKAANNTALASICFPSGLMLQIHHRAILFDLIKQLS